MARTGLLPEMYGPCHACGCSRGKGHKSAQKVRTNFFQHYERTHWAGGERAVDAQGGRHDEDGVGDRRGRLPPCRR